MGMIKMREKEVKKLAQSQENHGKPKLKTRHRRSGAKGIVKEEIPNLPGRGERMMVGKIGIMAKGTKNGLRMTNRCIESQSRVAHKKGEVRVRIIVQRRGGVRTRVRLTLLKKGKVKMLFASGKLRRSRKRRERMMPRN